MELVYVVVVRDYLEEKWVITSFAHTPNLASRYVHAYGGTGDEEDEGNVVRLWLRVGSEWRGTRPVTLYEAFMSYLKSGGSVEDVTPWN